MKTILVTGANGQLGQALQTLARQLPAEAYSFHFMNRRTLDITNKAAIEAFVTNCPVDEIVNCAAYTAVDQAEDEAARCEAVNATAVGYLAQAAAHMGARLIHISTDYVFDGQHYLPYSESDPTHPKTRYGQSKRRGEMAAMHYCPRAVIVRTSWLYAAHGHNFVQTMRRLGRERSELGVVSDQIGTPTYAPNLAEVILRIIEQPKLSGIYHYSNEGVCSWYDFALAIQRLSGNHCTLRPIHSVEYPTRAARPHYSVLDKSKIREALHIDIPHWFDALTRCIDTLDREEPGGLPTPQ